MEAHLKTTPGGRRPDWLKARAPSGPEFEEVMGLVTSLRLHTVCQSARCPNLGECWRERTATFMILGDTCTRDCSFCAVASGPPAPVDEREPDRVAEAVKALSLKHAVVTSVTRDDLPDGGASVFAATIHAIRREMPECTVEVLIPDLGGSREALRVVVEAKPDILNHNIETVPRMYPAVRPQAEYRRSSELLRRARAMDASILAKSGIMVGVGETMREVVQTMCDLRGVGCDILTVGQYLSPSLGHVPIKKYYTPQEFEQIRVEGLGMGFSHVESGPLVRSSYHAARALGEEPYSRV